MNNSARLVSQLETVKKLFHTTTSVFDEGDSGFAPDPELYTVAGQIAHAADSIEWFIEGGFGDGWDMDFEASIAKARAVESVGEAIAWFDRAVEKAITAVRESGEERLLEPVPDERIMGGAPRMAVVNALVDHTAHHRGSLAVYARLVGKAPPMLYS